MSIEIKVPVLPESVADALLLDWHKQAGDRVRRDEILVEVETDKIVLEVAAPEDGVVTEILHPAGDIVKEGEALARMEARAADEAADEAAGEAADETADKAADKTARDTSGDSPMSPAVRRMVEEHALDISAITGSGRDGRVTKEDVLAFISDQVAPDGPCAGHSSPAPAPQPAAPGPQPALPQTREQTREPMSRLRRTIAERLVEAQRGAALLTTFNEVNMQPVMDLRARYRDAFEQTHGSRLGFMSFFVKASVAALHRFPMVNAYIDGADIVRHNYCDIGIAVSSPRGLLVPILRNCEGLSFAGIEAQIREFGERAGDGKISLDDLAGGTFTITNGGVFGSLLSTPIVNPPQSAILGMHKIEQRPVAEDGRVVVRPMMYVALSYDHRIIDGREAVGFLVAVKDLLEDPARMLLQL
ncbi:MAG: 2-oxoglutarate dehydrogenase complex dihydrolipoyllysine-residue succinyltransferase [Gammaproteobacteria bacterium]|nr:2-oxoglutarate dehydrogenase complex dihydrolipoyllysine-residue succinyltransferase [Gammaproteobacteria bacterium]